MKYRQVTLLRLNVRKVAWIPNSLAKVGKIVRTPDGRDGWEVVEVSRMTMNDFESKIAARAYRTQRTVSDI